MTQKKTNRLIKSPVLPIRIQDLKSNGSGAEIGQLESRDIPRLTDEMKMPSQAHS